MEPSEQQQEQQLWDLASRFFSEDCDRDVAPLQLKWSES